MRDYFPEDEVIALTERVQELEDFLRREEERADEMERLLGEMAHAFHDADAEAYGEFQEREPGLVEVFGDPFSEPFPKENPPDEQDWPDRGWRFWGDAR